MFSSVAASLRLPSEYSTFRRNNGKLACKGQVVFHSPESVMMGKVMTRSVNDCRLSATKRAVSVFRSLEICRASIRSGVRGGKSFILKLWSTSTA